MTVKLKRNPQDITLRNLRAIRAALVKLTARVARLEVASKNLIDVTTVNDIQPNGALRRRYIERLPPPPRKWAKRA